LHQGWWLRLRIMTAGWVSTIACILHLLVACVCLRVVGRGGSPIRFGHRGISHIRASGWRMNMTFDGIWLGKWGLAVGHWRRFLPGLGYHLRHSLLGLLCLTLGKLHFSWVLGLGGRVPRRRRTRIHLVIGLEGLFGKLDFGILL
jgi:hypothetical protein